MFSFLHTTAFLNVFTLLQPAGLSAAQDSPPVALRTHQYIEWIRKKTTCPAIETIPIDMIPRNKVYHPDARAYYSPTWHTVSFNPIAWQESEDDFQSIEKDYYASPDTTITHYGLPLTAPGVVFTPSLLPWYKRLFKFKTPEENIHRIHHTTLHEFQHVRQRLQRNYFELSSVEKEKDADTVALETNPNPWKNLLREKEPYELENERLGYIFNTPQGLAISQRRTENPEQIYQTLRYQRELSHMPWNSSLRTAILTKQAQGAQRTFSGVADTVRKALPSPRQLFIQTKEPAQQQQQQQQQTQSLSFEEAKQEPKAQDLAVIERYIPANF